MAPGNLLIACPSCSCHAFARESHCPGCGALLRAADGSLQRTAGAAFLGLTLAFSAVACSSETGTSSTGAGGASTSASTGLQTMSTYGVGPSSGASGSTTGAGGAGGSGSSTGSK
jgi:hypothetical protein